MKKKEMEAKIAKTSIDKRVKVFTKGGEKAVVERIVRECVRELDRVAQSSRTTLSSDTKERKAGRTGVERREKMMMELKPVIETKSMKRSGIAHQVPTPVNDRRGLYRACNWIREATLKRAKKMGIPVGDARRMEVRALYDELRARESSAITGLSSVQSFTTFPMQMRDRTHRAAKANRVFASGR
jgi:ribosomal protein S7